jgi:DNA-binding NtrC family response regulator
VDTRVAVLRRTSDLLRRAGYDVIEAGTFAEAKRILATRSPFLVISGLRLAAFNGLHLVHLARLTQPDMNAIIISGSSDAVLQSEAERVGASLFVEPVPPSGLLALILQMFEADLAKAEGPIAERRRSDRRGLAADVATDRRIGERRVGVTVSVLSDRNRV